MSIYFYFFNGPSNCASISYCFGRPVHLHLVGEWWNADTEKVIQQALQTGGGPNVSDAYTINGLPGPLYNCSSINGNYICV